jgi:hypothetical protein
MGRKLSQEACIGEQKIGSPREPSSVRAGVFHFSMAKPQLSSRAHGNSDSVEFFFFAAVGQSGVRVVAMIK